MADQEWSTSILQSADTATLDPDQPIQNIWDPQNLRLLAWGNPLYNGQSNSPAWNIPSPNLSSDLNQVNVIINNNSVNSYLMWSPSTLLSEYRSFIVPPNQTIGLNLHLGRIYIVRLSNINLTDDDVKALVDDIKSAITNGTIPSIAPLNRYNRNDIAQYVLSDQTEFRLPLTYNTISIQVLPVPDQVINISETSDMTSSVTMVSNILSSLSLFEVEIHNCYKISMYVKQRPCTGVAGQNLALIYPGRSMKLQIFHGYQIYLQSADNNTVSSVLTTDQIRALYSLLSKYQRSRIIYFKNNGSISTESCTGTELDLSTTYPPVLEPKTVTPQSWWSQWWWAILIIVVIVILLLIMFVYAGREPPIVEVY